MRILFDIIFVLFSAFMISLGYEGGLWYIPAYLGIFDLAFTGASWILREVMLMRITNNQ